jgi:hypothetical protein
MSKYAPSPRYQVTVLILIKDYVIKWRALNKFIDKYIRKQDDSEIDSEQTAGA